MNEKLKQNTLIFSQTSFFVMFLIWARKKKQQLSKQNTVRPRTVKHFADSVLELKFPMDKPRVHLAIERTVIISIFLCLLVK